MGMTIDEIIQDIDIIKAQAEWEYPLDWQVTLDEAMRIIKKYQQIEQIVNCSDDFIQRNAEYRLQEISEVINGNDD